MSLGWSCQLEASLIKYDLAWVQPIHVAVYLSVGVGNTNTAMLFTFFVDCQQKLFFARKYLEYDEVFVADFGKILVLCSEKA